jgi:hypothetical protein
MQEHLPQEEAAARRLRSIIGYKIALSVAPGVEVVASLPLSDQNIRGRSRTHPDCFSGLILGGFEHP